MFLFSILPISIKINTQFKKKQMKKKFALKKKIAKIEIEKKFEENLYLDLTAEFHKNLMIIVTVSCGNTSYLVDTNKALLNVFICLLTKV